MEQKITSLSPMDFLQKFNKMSEQFNKTESKFKSTSASKLTTFKKFPIPVYYNNMEGLNVNIKDRQEQEIVKANRFNKLDEQFRRKHNNFMRHTLTKIIDNNLKHMKTIQKSKQFYSMRATHSQKSLQRALSTRQKQRGKRKGHSKQKQQIEQQFPQINFKTVDRKRVKSAYMISFNPNKKQLSSTQTTFKYKQPNPSKLITSVPPTFRQSSTQQGKRKSIISLTSQQSNRLFTSKQLSKHSKNSNKNYQIDLLMDPQKYIKTRFSDTSKTIQYDYSHKVKKLAQNFTKQIIYHYTNDENDMI